MKSYEHHRDKLLQTSRCSRSVLLKKICNKHNFDLTLLKDIKDGTLDKITQQSMAGMVDCSEFDLNILSDSIQSDNADAARAKLTTLSRNLRHMEDETGRHAGYLGFPFLEGHLNPDFYIRSPIILFPVSLERKRQAKNGGWFLHFGGKRPMLNGALLEAIRKKTKYNITDNHEEAFDELLDDLPKNFTEEQFVDILYKWLCKNVVPITSYDVATTKLPNMLNCEIISNIKQQDLTITNHKILGNFPQADSEIYADYQKLIEDDSLDSSDLIDGLLGIKDSRYDSNDPVDINDIQDQEINQILRSDPSQDWVMLASKTFDAVVMRGPPGTGKSQTIVNLIADALSNEERVLLVCQKRAALEAVKQRLEVVGLDRHIIFLEKELEDKKRMYQHLAQTATNKEDCTYPQETIQEISDKIDSKARYLDTLEQAMSKEYFGGATAHKIYAQGSGKYTPVFDMSSTVFDTKWSQLDGHIEKIKAIQKYYNKFESSEHPWFGRRNFSELGITDKNNLQKKLTFLKETFSLCMLADTSDKQDMLYALFKKYADQSSLLKKLARHQSAKKIEYLLERKITEEYVRQNFERVRSGVEFWRIFNDILQMFEEPPEPLDIKNPLFVDHIQSMQSSLNDFDDLMEFDKKKLEYDPSIFILLKQAKTHFDGDKDYADKIRQEILWHWLSHIEGDNRILCGKPIDTYNQRRDELERLMNRRLCVVQRQTAYRINNSLSVRNYSDNRESKRWTKFVRDLRRVRNLKPVRGLFEEYDSMLFKLAPCWLMSPEMVSKVFPLQKNLFDLVIIDEASQLAVERAVPFLYRARRVVIAGDEKQLPPSDLFQMTADDNDDDDISQDILPEKTSLLNLARGRCPTFDLRWHYRSNHPELIDFSNHAFYDGNLNVIPNAVNDPKDPSVRWVSCNGVWENRKNMVEAERVVDEMRDIWQSDLNLSIGVITFSSRQQECIEDRIDARLDSDANFLELYTGAHHDKRQNDLLFVKDVENVQGDERDIIILSIGYAKDARGNFVNRFGTLDRNNGENKINVAVTRARQKMIVVSSIDPAVIRPALKNDGPRRLRQFLEYAQAASSFDKIRQNNVFADMNPDMKRVKMDRSDTFDSDLERQVYAKLCKKGYRVESRVGFPGYRIDLAVVHPDDENRYILGIECDGDTTASLHSSKGVKERDITQQKFLEKRGWKFARIWSRNWWKSPDLEIDRIDKMIQSLRAVDIMH